LTGFGVGGPAQAPTDLLSIVRRNGPAAEADLDYDIPFDNKNFGQAPSQIIAEKND
jgi:hypothetical protein